MRPEIVQCGLDHFQEHYAPFQIPEQQVSVILANLFSQKNAVCNKYGEGKGVFKPFDKALPRNEDDAYRPLKQIVDAVAKAASVVLGDFASTRELNYYLRCCTRTEVDSDISGSEHLVHGAFEKRCLCDSPPETQRKKESSVGWHTVSDHPSSGNIEIRNIAAVCEFNLELEGRPEKIDILDNQENVVSANVQIMNEDPRRMFTYGLTVEGYEMTLW
ncbi:hypothetical protein CPC08DRAFT_755991, partial [Agrocybe pediades]